MNRTRLAVQSCPDWYDALYCALEELLPATRSDAQAIADIHNLEPCYQAGMPAEVVARALINGCIGG